MPVKAAHVAVILLVGLPSLGTAEGRSDVFGVVEGHHLTLQLLEVFCSLLASLLGTPFPTQKALGSELMATGALAPECGEVSRGGRDLAVLPESQRQ